MGTDAVPSVARLTALEVLRRVRRGAFTAPALGAALDASALDGIDRSLVTDLVYGVQRHERFVDAALAPLLRSPEGLPDDVRLALRFGAYEILVRETARHAAVNEWVDVVKGVQRRLGGLANAVLRRVEPPSRVTDAERYGVPDWLYSHWEEAFGDDAPAIARGMQEPEPLWLSAYAPEAAESLAADGAAVEPGPVPGTLRARLQKPLTDHAAWRDGLVQPQNPASTLPVTVLGPKDGERVLDLASGSGVKAALLAARGAVVESVELDPRKLRRAERNLTRLGLRATGMVHDLRTPPPLEPALRVLLDAPCSGTGTLRGNPEIRTRVTPDIVRELAALQRNLLESAAAVTAPGGVLVYAVCALTHEEGEGNARWFVEHHPEFAMDSEFATGVPERRTATGAYTLPTGGLDGFFLARFRRSEP